MILAHLRNSTHLVDLNIYRGPSFSVDSCRMSDYRDPSFSVDSWRMSNSCAVQYFLYTFWLSMHASAFVYKHRCVRRTTEHTHWILDGAQIGHTPAINRKRRISVVRRPVFFVLRNENFVSLIWPKMAFSQRHGPRAFDLIAVFVKQKQYSTCSCSVVLQQYPVKTYNKMVTIHLRS